MLIYFLFKGLELKFCLGGGRGGGAHALKPERFFALLNPKDT